MISSKRCVKIFLSVDPWLLAISNFPSELWDNVVDVKHSAVITQFCSLVIYLITISLVHAVVKLAGLPYHMSNLFVNL